MHYEKYNPVILTRNYTDYQNVCIYPDRLVDLLNSLVFRPFMGIVGAVCCSEIGTGRYRKQEIITIL